MHSFIDFKDPHEHSLYKVSIRPWLVIRGLCILIRMIRPTLRSYVIIMATSLCNIMPIPTRGISMTDIFKQCSH
jgi:hypothetical protein